MKARETAGSPRQMYKHQPPVPPPFSKCVLVALIWYEVALVSMKRNAPLLLEEKGRRLWQFDEVAFRAVLLAVRFF